MNPSRVPQPPDHICVVLLSGLGDVVHGLPVINALRDSNPRMRVTWVAEPMPAQVLVNHPSVDHVIEYQREDGIRGVRKLRSDLRAAGPFDATINFNVYFKSIWPTLLSRAPRRIGFDRARSFEGVWLFANEHLRSMPRAHTADMFLEFAAHLGVEVTKPDWRIRFTRAELDEQRAFFDGLSGKPVATVIPASATSKKDWLPVRWAEVVDGLMARGFEVVLAGGPGAREQTIGQEIVAAASAKVEWAMGDSVRRLAWIIAGSQLVVAPDTGPVHIARAFGVPVVGIYGHTNPWRVGPWRAYQNLWVDHYTAGEPDAANRTPKWDVMPGIASAEILAKVDVAAREYAVASGAVALRR
ncbi:MAG: glycosyltransferase family 9 protein [Gemmatimonadota bacterium]|nr:glycosyltransferase family 9 protein [Gemmatimonadota bacterium]